MLRIPYCLDNRLTDGGKIVSLKHWPRSAPQKYYFFASDTYFSTILFSSLCIIFTNVIFHLVISILKASRPNSEKIT
jgi:hypothetical protein